MGFACATMAQKGHVSVSLTPALLYYVGDLKSSPWPEKGYNNWSLGLDVNYQVSNVITVGLGYSRGKVSGADSLKPEEGIRNLHFEAPINDIRVLTYIDLNAIRKAIWKSRLMGKQDWKRGLIGPEIILGGGVVNFTPRGHYEGQVYNLHKLGTEGQRINGGGYPEPYSKWQINAKFGGSIGYALGRQFHVRAFGIYTMLFTDYLDDVGGVYPNYNDIQQQDNADVLGFFTYGGRDGAEVPEGKLRSNPDSNDGYVFIGLQLTYVMSKDQMRRFIHF